MPRKISPAAARGAQSPRAFARFAGHAQTLPARGPARRIDQSSEHVYVYGTEEIEGAPVITMEIVEGGTLHERVKERGPLSVSEAVDVILQIIAGLEAAHAIGILHRDIKPSNCFIEADGTVKVGDFGLSISTTTRGDSALTMAGSVLGTPEFSSPEQLRGEELNVRSDIYSVGMTLYFLLTGRTPFQAENVVQLLATVLDKPAPSPRTLRPEIPEALARIVLRCLEKQAGDRFKNYDELRRALLPFNSTAPTPATLGLRFVAGVIDFLVFMPVGLAALIFGGFDGMMDGSVHALALLAGLPIGSLVLQIAYFAVSEGLWGATPGKALVGLRVGGLDRNAPGIPRALLRALIYLVPGDGFLAALPRAGRRADVDGLELRRRRRRLPLSGAARRHSAAPQRLCDHHRPAYQNARDPKIRLRAARIDRANRGASRHDGRDAESRPVSRARSTSRGR
jgi:uncharacterized RDD family membrane protein YckC